MSVLQSIARNSLEVKARGGGTKCAATSARKVFEFDRDKLCDSVSESAESAPTNAPASGPTPSVMLRVAWRDIYEES